MNESVKTIGKCNLKVPPGCIVVNNKWKGTPTYDELKRKFNNVVTKDLNHFDFCLSDDKQVIYVSEFQLMTNSNSIKLSDCRAKSTVTIADRNTITAEHYAKLQDEIVIRMGLNLYPVGNISELPEFLYKLSTASSLETGPNQYKRKSFISSKSQQLDSLLVVPQLGKLRAQKLLEKFGTLQSIALSPVSELSLVIGHAKAAQVYNFFSSF